MEFNRKLNFEIAFYHLITYFHFQSEFSNSDTIIYRCIVCLRYIKQQSNNIISEKKKLKPFIKIQFQICRKTHANIQNEKKRNIFI